MPEQVYNWVMHTGLCHLGGWAMPRTPSSAAMTTSARRWLSGRTVTWLSCSTGWTAAWRRPRGRASASASSGGSWSSSCSAGHLPACAQQSTHDQALHDKNQRAPIECSQPHEGHDHESTLAIWIDNGSWLAFMSHTRDFFVVPDDMAADSMSVLLCRQLQAAW